MSSDLLEAFQVLTDLAVEYVGQGLRVLAVLDVLLPVEEPVWNLVLARVRHHGNHLLHLVQDIKTKLRLLSWSTTRSTTRHHHVYRTITNLCTISFDHQTIQSTLLLVLTSSHLGDQAFASAKPRLWNSRPTHVRQHDLCFDTFYRKLKMYLIDTRLSDCCFKALCINFLNCLFTLSSDESPTNTTVTTEGFLPKVPQSLNSATSVLAAVLQDNLG